MSAKTKFIKLMEAHAKFKRHRARSAPAPAAQKRVFCDYAAMWASSNTVTASSYDTTEANQDTAYDPILSPISTSDKKESRRARPIEMPTEQFHRSLRAANRALAVYGVFASISAPLAIAERPLVLRGVVSRAGKEIAVESRGEPITIDLASERFRFCKNKICARLSIDSRQAKQVLGNGLAFRRRFSTIEFCLDNRAVPLERIIQHLLALGVKPSAFMEGKIMAFYNQDVSAQQLAADISYYSLFYDVEELPLDLLMVYLGACIAELCGDTGCASLFAMVDHVRIMHRRWFSDCHEPCAGRCYDDCRMLLYRRAAAPHLERTPIPKRSLESIGSHSESKICLFASHGVSSPFSTDLSMNIAKSIREAVGNLAGYPRIRRLYEITEEYRAWGAIIPRPFIEECLGDAMDAVPRASFISAVSLLGHMHLCIAERNLLKYHLCIKEISTKFCEALNSMLKAGEDTQNIYESLSSIILLPHGVRGGVAGGRIQNGPKTGALSTALQGSPGIFECTDRLIARAILQLAADAAAVIARRIRKVKGGRVPESIQNAMMENERVFGCIEEIEKELATRNVN